jgi:hypothetical protein
MAQQHWHASQAGPIRPTVDSVFSVAQPTWSQQDTCTVVSTVITHGSQDHHLWYRVSGSTVARGSDALLAAVLLPAMTAGAPLRVGGSISPRLLAASSTIQDIFATWDPTLRRVSIQPAVFCSKDVGLAQDVGCFFSGGVDSWYSFLKHREEVSALIFVHGFDIALQDTPLRERASQVIRRVAAHLQKPLIEVETNLRAFSDQYVSWESYHGSALASVALLLSPQMHTVYIAAAHTYRHLIPLGSHPILDPLWSTETMQIVHDGCEATRQEKVRRFAECDLALKTLRVCWENPESAYNCGKCRKCQTTMVDLYLAGALHRCTTFDQPLDLRKVSRLMPSASTFSLLEASLEAAERLGEFRVARALRDCLTQRYEKSMWRLGRGARNFVRRLIASCRNSPGPLGRRGHRHQ